MAISVIGTNQRVLVILCFPQDKMPDDFGDPDTIRDTQVDVYNQLVNRGVRQMSYGLTSFNFDFTEWLQLPQDDDFYFTRESGSASLAEHPANDAFAEAGGAGFALNDYEGFVICMATDHLRGWASGYNAGLYFPSNSIFPTWLTTRKHVNVVSLNAHWGRRIHEISHHLGVGDYYGSPGVISNGDKWDIGGRANRMPLYSSYNLQRMGWYNLTNIRELMWTEVDFDDSFIIQAHDLVEDNTGNRVHMVKITIFPGLIYYIEVRQQPDVVPSELSSTLDSLTDLQPAADFSSANPDNLLFDTHVPGIGTTPHKGGVIVLKTVIGDAVDNMNQAIRRVTTLSPSLMQVGNEVVDAARRIKIRVEELISERPLAFRVRVTWSQVAEADPDGLFNLRLEPWDSNWQTPDIWIDSEQNEWDTYENLDAAGLPAGNGDRPWVGHKNRFYARINNDGIEDANDVQVTFYTNTPPAIGDNGTWVPHTVKTISSISAGTSEKTFCEWTPVVGEHTCLKVAVETQLGETIVGDNQAQENVFDFDTSASSPHQPILKTVSIQNPLKEPAIIRLTCRGLPNGWEATLEHEWLWLPPLGEAKMRVMIFTDLNRPRPLAQYRDKKAKRAEIPREARVLIEGGIFRWLGEGPDNKGHSHHLQPIGGIQIVARARKGIDIDLELDHREVKKGKFIIRGNLTPPHQDVIVYLEATRSDGDRKIVQVKTAKDGSFGYALQDKALKSQKSWRIQAFVTADETVADTVSNLLIIESHSRWYVREP